MTGVVQVRPGDRGIDVAEGPVLLSGLLDGPSLLAHRRRHSEPPVLDAASLADLARSTDLRGRGGAGFPFATKLETAARTPGAAQVVVNLAEGEPASWKDSVLATVAPHLILDGAVLAAGALRTRRVSVVVPVDRPGVHAAVRSAIEERRRRDPVRWRVHEVRGGFVSGQARAVVELLSGRQNLPVTSWETVAVRGVKGRPTLLCNAETYAALAAGLSHQEAVPTQLLTIDGDGSRPRVLEVTVGTSWRAVLPAAQLAAPVLVGGYHGSWFGAGGLEDLVVCRDAMTAAGAGLGAGVVLPLVDGCPLHRTAQLTSYLARQSARRCGPCLNGLPALAEAVHELDLGRPSRARADHLVARVRGRGACGHPDGTARLVMSLLSTWPDEHVKHATGRCSFRPSRASVPLERGRVVRR